MRLATSVLVLGLALAGGRADAQSPLTFGLGGSLTVPVGGTPGFGLGDGSSALGAGWQGIGLLQIRPFGGNFGFQLDGSYQRITPGAVSYAGRQVFSGTANLVYEFGRSRTSTVVPYVIGGAGVYTFQRGIDASTTRFGVSGGAGLNLNLGPGALFVESRFHNVFGAGLGADGRASSTRLIPITAGFKFTAP
ncbi:MAG TPA: outer membrane beta-barrel protein [Gemmatimonadales bacterium]|nr:outer membrane beta-barrel protein [Gemmatimonadales bacterium]